MCNNIWLTKYCTGHGPTDEWELYNAQKCNCDLPTRDIYRQPHPYLTFRCEDCVKNNRWYENRPAGIEWRRKHEEAEKEEEKARIGKSGKNKVKKRMT